MSEQLTSLLVLIKHEMMIQLGLFLTLKSEDFYFNNFDVFLNELEVLIFERFKGAF